MFDEKDISRNLKKYLEQSRVQQKELAIECNKTEGTISHWVDGRVSIPVKYIPIICKMLDITLYDLFGLPDNSLLSEKEKEVIKAYRNDDEFRIIVNRVLNINKREEQ